jgi:Na+-driven multidrug efflux pump
MVSNVIGQNLENHVKELVYKITRLGLLFSCSIALFINIFIRYFLSAYGQSDHFIDAAIPVARIISLALVLQSVAAIWLNAVVGTGNSRRNLVVEIVAIFLYSVYVYSVLEYFQLSISLGWMSEWLYWIVIFIPSFWYMQSNKWMGKKI